MIIDTHVHLDADAYQEDLESVMSQSISEEVNQFIIPGADPATLPRAVKIAHQYNSVYFSVGIHPYDIDNYSDDIFTRYVHDDKCVAIGECGLDYFRLEGTAKEQHAIKEKQKHIFEQQILLAIAHKKPLIVHIRDASSDAKEILMRYADKLYGGVLHCFNADEQLLSLAKYNFYFGIGGVLTFKNAKKLVNVLPKIPKERLLIETDGPYLTPHPHRGARNEPKYCKLVAKKMAELLECSLNEIEALTTKNANQLFFANLPHRLENS